MQLETRYSFVKNKRLFTLLEDECFLITQNFFTVPARYVFDGATVPRFFWSIFVPTGKGFEAACLHDYLYDTLGNYGEYSRKECDLIFYDHLKLTRVGNVQSYIYYFAVRWFGWRFWNRYSLPTTGKRKNPGRLPGV